MLNRIKSNKTANGKSAEWKKKDWLVYKSINGKGNSVNIQKADKWR